MSEEPLDWSRSYWQGLSVLEGFRPVIDPNDEAGGKNQRINHDHEKIIHETLRCFAPCKVASILDFGCGIGRNYFILKSSAEKYVGADISSGMLDRASRVVSEDDSLVLVSGPPLPFAGGIFDIVFSFWTLQHVTDDRMWNALIKEFHRIISPNGLAIVYERSGAEHAERGKDPRYIRKRGPEEYMHGFHMAGFRLIGFNGAKYSDVQPDPAKLVVNEKDNMYVFKKD